MKKSKTTGTWQFLSKTTALTFFSLLILTACQKQESLDINGNEAEFVSFEEFKKAATEATFDQYAGKEGVLVADERAFTRMKDHLQNMYRGVAVAHSFQLEDGRMCDCIPKLQQPGLKRSGMEGHTIAAPPSISVTPTNAPESADNIDEPGAEADPKELMTDKFGNSRTCKQDFIPMIRISLNTMTGFRNLDDFFHKCPDGNCFLGDFNRAAHRYAYMGTNGLTNFGGNSGLNIWQPIPVDNNNFSLSQQWYTGSGQTVEGGWQVYRNRTGTTKPALFIYYTSNNYAPGSGCYDLTCAGFVQTSNNWVIGSAFNTTSVYNGNQYSFVMRWFKDGTTGHWWLWCEGYGRTAGWVGYYPRSIFGSGQMANNATRVLYGGEVTSASSTSLSRQMGSGQYANQGWGRAAYQRQVYYYPSTSGAYWFTSATENEPQPTCYTINKLYSSSSTYGAYFYYGGPSCDP